VTALPGLAKVGSLDLGGDLAPDLRAAERCREPSSEQNSMIPAKFRQLCLSLGGFVLPGMSLGSGLRDFALGHSLGSWFHVAQAALHLGLASICWYSGGF
jgi:hypothetical protein